jgi:D-beta-D-heptose 7-phosphate kinase/D-beta-D-heptose 1-phosphate adenosyltransferase
VANHSHQVLRIDHEDETPVSREIEQKLLNMVLDALPSQRVVLVSDYQKGSISDWGIRTIVEAAGKAGIPVVANPKPKSLPSYSGACLVSLNRFEAADALRLDEITSSEAAASAAKQLRESLGVENVLVTLGGDGMVAASSSGSFHVPAIPVAVYDEAGAGDTVIATLALAVAAGNFGREALELASRAAAAVVRKVGVATPSKQDLDELRDL